MRYRHSPGFRAVASILVGLLAAPAWASDGGSSQEFFSLSKPRKPRLAVVAFALDDSSRAAAKLSYLAEKLTVELGRQELRDLAAALDPEGYEAHKSFVATADEAVKKARAAYDELEPKRAKELCDQAVGAYEKSDLSRSFGELVRARMLRIASLIANAEATAADREVEQLLPLDLHTPFDPNLFAPDFVAEVKRRRADLTAQRGVGLDIEVRPVPGRVYIDGRYRGISSVELRNLTAGDHVLTVVAPGYKVLQKIVRPGAGGTRVETLRAASGLERFSEKVRRIKNDFRGKGRNKVARELAVDLGVDQVLVIGVKAKDKDQLAALAVRVDASDGHEHAYVEEPLPNDEQRFEPVADTFLRKALSTDRPRGEDGKAIATTGGGFQWRARHTGYVLLGLGAIALGSGIYFGLDANKLNDRYNALQEPQTSPTYKSLETNGRRSALIADVSYLAALIAGGTGLYLAITGRGIAEDDLSNVSIEERKRVSRSPRADDEVVPASDRSERDSDDDLRDW
ncbi:MAG: PEGA domain-containing protein [Myxococcales bacterium]|jgi:hypothetical protein